MFRIVHIPTAKVVFEEMMVKEVLKQSNLVVSNIWYRPFECDSYEIAESILTNKTIFIDKFNNNNPTISETWSKYYSDSIIKKHELMVVEDV